MDEALAKVLLPRYREPHRRYHDEQHLKAVLVHVGELSEHAQDAEAVRLAAWFHDAVYDPRRDDNEEVSAQLAEGLLPIFGVPGPRVLEVARLVRLTATHEVDDGDDDGAVLCDADLAVLAAGPDEYAGYAAGIRAEHAFVDESTFASARAAVLRRLLDRPRIYRTSTAHDRWEADARRNIPIELMLLEASGGEDPPA
jgi:predicted metal-dependent HD superfamily phosphohydrolase